MRETVARRLYKAKNIKSLIDHHGDVITDPIKMLNEEKIFYSNLCTREHLQQPEEGTNIFELNESLAKLDNDTKQLCEKDLTIPELSDALKHMPNNKSPGPDGFSTEFYKLYVIYVILYVTVFLMLNIQTG